jgi:hypothetical protein
MRVSRKVGRPTRAPGDRRGLQRRPALCAVAVLGPEDFVEGDEAVQLSLMVLNKT